MTKDLSATCPNCGNWWHECTCSSRTGRVAGAGATTAVDA